MSRKKRVQRLKRIIIVAMVVLILLPNVLSIYLFIQVRNLKKEMKELYQTRVEYLRGQAEQAAAVSEEANEDGVLNVADSEKIEVDNGDPVYMDDSEVDGYRVYLTFDDGPSARTAEILDILKQYNVKATFFVTGKTDKKLLPLYKRIVDEGHTIGMHSYSHDYKEVYQTVGSFENDLDSIRELIYNQTGVWSNYYRFPGGSSNDMCAEDMENFIHSLQDRKIQYYDWNVASGDATSTSLSKEQIQNNIMSSYSKYHTSIVLLHDSGNRKSTVEALPQIIEEFQRKGVELRPIDDNTTLVQQVQVN